MKRKSTVTFIRKELGIKGKNNHTSLWCDEYPTSYSENIGKKIDEWVEKGLCAVTINDQTNYELQFDANKFYKYNVLLHKNPQVAYCQGNPNKLLYIKIGVCFIDF